MPMGEDHRLPGYGGIPHPVHGNIDFIGEIFLWGLAGGSAFHLVRGLRHDGRHLALQAVGSNALRVAGTFGAYSAFFSGVETGVSVARGGREDIWCSISASAVTWGLHGMRRGGAPAAARCAFLGVTGFMALAGLSNALMKWQSRNNFLRRQKPRAPHRPAPILSTVVERLESSHGGDDILVDSKVPTTVS